MLRRYLYLDSEALTQYMAALEDGLVTEATRRSSRGRSGGAGIDAKVVKASTEGSTGTAEEQTIADTDESRFERLLVEASADPESLAWVEALEPDTDFEDIGIGAMVSWECDIYVPDVVQMVAKSGEALNAIGMMSQLLPAAERLGLDTDGLPTEDEMNAAASFMGAMKARLLVVGEDDETEWRIAGSLTDEYLRADLDGRARVVGKVTKTLKHGRWKPYLTLPGMKLLPREERRKLERKKPEPGKEDEYLSGPALLLDVLAIYR